MADDEILRRMDAHMARGNEIMQRSNEVIAENRRAFDENRRAFDENRQAMQEDRQAFEDLRTTLHQITLRHERVLGALADRIEENTRLLREHRREFVEEMRAQRAALFRILDRLDGGGEAAGA